MKTYDSLNNITSKNRWLEIEECEKEDLYLFTSSNGKYNDLIDAINDTNECNKEIALICTAVICRKNVCYNKLATCRKLDERSRFEDMVEIYKIILISIISAVI
jgi:hypothetical protein